MSGPLQALSALAALVLSYVVGFAALAVLLLPYLGGWGIILSIGGVIIALPFRAAAALALLRRSKTRSHSRLALTIGPTPPPEGLNRLRAASDRRSPLAPGSIGRPQFAPRDAWRPLAP